MIHSELFEELGDKYDIFPGDLGENITTCGIDLLALPKDTILSIGATAVIQITGLRNPCAQLDHFQPGLMNAVLDRDDNGNLIRKAGIMAIVLESGEVRPGDNIRILLPPLPHKPLARV